MKLKLHNLHISRSTVAQLRIFNTDPINRDIIYSDYSQKLIDHKLLNERVNFSFFSLYRGQAFRKLI